MIERRTFLAQLGATLAAGMAAGSARGGILPPVFISAAMRSSDRDGAAVNAFDLDGRLLFSTRLPERGHDATARPHAAEIVVFARRPGNWAAVIDRATGTVRQVITSPPGRHFFGHGAFSPDGRLLYATENLIATGEGVLGIYDAAAGYLRVGEMPTHGLGPHDLGLLPDGAMLVANGGTRTQPETGREILNPDSMRPSLAVVDLEGGEPRHVVELGRNLRGLSIRHLAIASDGQAAFACQWEGSPDEGPPLVGLFDPEAGARFLDMPEDDLAALDNYVGSVALSAGESLIAATSPKGGTVAFWDRASRRYLGRKRLPDVCGVAPALGQPSGSELFVVTSGHGGAYLAGAGPRGPDRFGDAALGREAWDNHVLAL
ncbi:DUF1513 domain-containing protein [Enterovirga aerilata]|uniref:DUF1513 domain-containing protein n=1 Tax=Enterovirga aerilata TaxID=2730920 RepID=A0A849I7W3_9HYPH|nr:DUF1513 domain-containing protein [Enterovirga sp. DB1703]NNM73401.1 DUF1513 domain-containing protein [Enterovirga sp. DB1703]